MLAKRPVLLRRGTQYLSLEYYPSLPLPELICITAVPVLQDVLSPLNAPPTHDTASLSLTSFYG